MHWAGSTAFCGEFCHSMDASYASYKKGLHFNTPAGIKVGCSDCHLLNESNEHNSPLQYSALLLDKAKSGTHSLIAELKGNLDTLDKQISERDRMAKDVEALMVERNFSNCRGCHDVTNMQNPKKPLVSKLHHIMKEDAKVPANCLSCHPTAGHDYQASQADLDKLRK